MIPKLMYFPGFFVNSNKPAIGEYELLPKGYENTNLKGDRPLDVLQHRPQ